MPRVKLKEQPHYEFRYDLTVRVTDLNYAAHLANSAVVALVHEARIQFLDRLGLQETNLGDGKTGLIMGDLVVNFKQEGFLFDKLTVYSHIDEFSRKGFRVFHKITRNRQPVALVETGLVAFDYTTRETTPIPASFFQALEKYGAGVNSSGW